MQDRDRVYKVAAEMLSQDEQVLTLQTAFKQSEEEKIEKRPGECPEQSA